MKKRTLIIIALIVACVAVLIAWVIKRELGRRPGITVVSAGPLDIRLWGVRPDVGGVIYDPNGNKLQNTLGIARWDRFPTRDGFQRCDFIFELPGSNGAPLFTYAEIRVSGKDGPGSWAHPLQIRDCDGRQLLWLNTRVARTFRKPILFGLWKRDIKVEAIDMRLHYYQGPPDTAICAFKGPFKPRQKVSDATGLYEISLHQDPNVDYARCHRFELTTKQPLSPRICALVYDTAGKRHIVRPRGVSSQQGGINIVYEAFDGYAKFDKSLKSVKLITFGEKTFETTFENVRLDLPGRKYRSYPDYFDTMAQQLDLRAEPMRLGGYALGGLEESIKVAEIVRGIHVLQVAQGIRYGLDPTKFNADQVQKVKRVALGWTKAMDPEIREQAIVAGLKCGWSEFVEPACKLLRYSSSHDRSYEVARALTIHPKLLSDQAIERITEILPFQNDRNILLDLRGCLTSCRSEARIKALRQLARDDRPWLWWDATEKLVHWGQFEDEHDELPQKLKLRLFLVAGPAGFSNPEQIAPEAYRLLTDQLTRQLQALDSRTFLNILSRIARNPDREAAIAAMIDFLRTLEDEYYYDPYGVWPIGWVVKLINLWHGVNIGKLGTDYNHKSPNPHKYDWPAITAEAIEWYDSRNNAVDANCAR